MGFLTASCRVLLYARKHLGVDHSRTLTLGRQELFMKVPDLQELARAYGIGTAEQIQRLDRSQGYAEPFLELLGADRIESIDSSDYEQATIVHDLNVPVPSSLHHRFTCVVDGGTIEHVFHFPNAIKSCMDMLETGGHYIGITPANNHMGHGFYQFSPELYYRVFGAENGFEVRTMLVRSASDWYEVADPKALRERTELVNAVPVTLFIIARKNRDVEGFHIPQQSDYVSAWKAQDPGPNQQGPEKDSRARHLVRRILPTGVKTWLRRIKALTRNTAKIDGLGTIDTKHFKRIDLL
jgi:hypothetical protein